MNDSAVPQRPANTCTISSRNGFLPSFPCHLPPYFGSTCKHTAEEIQKLPQAGFYWVRDIFNLEQFSTAIHHMAIQTTPAS